MSIFGSIMGKIFGQGAHAAPAPTPGSTTAPGSPPPSSSTFNNPPPVTPAPGNQSATTSASAASSSAAPVDVEKVLTDLAAKQSQKLDWRHSIVDLMKLLDLDSSLSNRQALAKELHYSGSMDDSASMNIWLHKQVMQQLAANGGKVPDDLK